MSKCAFPYSVVCNTIKPSTQLLNTDKCNSIGNKFQFYWPTAPWRAANCKKPTLTCSIITYTSLLDN